MRPIDAITEEEFETMRTWVKIHTDDACGGIRMDIKDILLMHWNKEKQKLFDLFGQKLILDKVIEVDKTSHELERAYYETETLHNFIDKINAWLWRSCQDINSNLGLSTDEVINNSLTEQRVLNYGEKRHVFPKGCKTMKYLAALFEAFPELPNKDWFEKSRIEQSMLLNTKKTKVRLCLSIHPMDYMTMSDNPYNWESCMNWSDGCYRMGTVEMMNSPCVIVAYIRGKKKLDVSWNNKLQKNVEWNGKRWRELFVVNPTSTDYKDRGTVLNLISEIKAYPYRNQEYTQAVLDWLVELCREQNQLDYIQSKYTHRGEAYDNINIGASTGLMYNDFNNTDYCNLKIALPVRPVYNFCYSGVAQCMYCGEDSDCSYEDSILCDDCNSNERCRCCSCGARINPDYDDYYCDDNGEYYCSDCRDEYFTFDQVYEEYIYNEDVIEVYYASMKNEPSKYNDSSFYTNINNFEIIEDGDDETEIPENGRFIRRTSRGVYYVNIDEAPRIFLDIQFYNNQSLRDYCDEESYVGLTAISLDDRTYYSYRDSYKTAKRFLIA